MSRTSFAGRKGDLRTGERAGNLRAAERTGNQKAGERTRPLGAAERIGPSRVDRDGAHYVSVLLYRVDWFEAASLGSPMIIAHGVLSRLEHG
jgi:hypothetical protein